MLRKRLHRPRARGECLRRVVVVGHELAVIAHHPPVAPGALPRARGGRRLPAAAPRRPGRPAGVRHVRRRGRRRSSAAGADTVIVLSCPELDGHVLRRLAWRLERDDIDLIVASALIDVAGDRTTIRPVDGLPMLHVEHPRLEGGARVVKEIVRPGRGRAAPAAVRPAAGRAVACGSGWARRGRCSSVRCGSAATAGSSGSSSSAACTSTPSSGWPSCATSTSTTACSSRCATTRGSLRSGAGCAGSRSTSSRS